MRKYGLFFCICLTISQFIAAAEFRSVKGGFQASFPGEVEENIVDSYSSAWTSFEFIDEIFVMHQVAVLKEKPGGSLHYESHDENKAFFNMFLKELMQAYSNSRVITSEYYLWKDKYPAIRYTFQGVMIGYDIEVINEGLALLYNRKLVKSALIFPTILEDDNRLIRMVNGFHNSLVVF
jgi:hypothetical protein